MMRELTQKAAASLRDRWSDGDAHRSKVMRQRIAGYVAGILKQIERDGFDGETYDRLRFANWIPRWKVASQYFDGVEELLDAASHYNHRVVSVRRLDERENVYDITVAEHHNFLLADGVFVHNSVDDDPAAAMRYTETKMSVIASELLADIDKDTVDFKENYDGHSTEPVVLPARLPNLLLNGSAGIAVGMATNIPPHNLREVCDGVTYLIDHPDATTEDLMRIVRGPDFPTGGLIQGREGIRGAYTAGRGRIVVRAKAHVEETERGKNSIIVTELPYQVNKADLVKKISELARDKKIDGITDVRDESDRQGMRIVIDLRRDARNLSVLNQLFKFTSMQTTFGANMLALVDGQPRTLTLKQFIQHYVTYRESVITRRTKFDLAKAQARQHILEGLTTALDNLDAVIDTIRRSQNRETASNNLRTRFKLSEEQAKAILDMQLGRLAALERRKIVDELAEVKKTIADLQRILANISEVRSLIKRDMEELKEKYGDPRRTEIVESEATDFTEEDLIPNDEVVVMMTQGGYVKRINSTAYRAQRRGGRGSRGITTHEDDTVLHLLSAMAHDALLFFTNRGRVFQLKAYGLPDVGRTARGEHLRNLIGIDQQESVTAVVRVPKFVARDYMVLGTRRGEVKKTSLDDFASVRSLGLIAMDLEPGDELIGARLTQTDDTVMMITEHGQAIRFSVQDLRAASRMSGGVRGIRLDDGDAVVALVVPSKDSELLVVTTNGYGKRTPVEEYPTHGRGGGGIITARLTDKTGVLAAARILTEEDRDLMIVSAEGTVIRTDWHTVAQSGRPTQGVRLMNMSPKDRVVSIATLYAEVEEDDGLLVLAAEPEIDDE
jgi:DNA gyrase subunit A